MARYQKIHSQIWQDEKFITLSQDAKYLFLYILTSPHSNSIGLYVLPKQYILADLEWDMKRLAKPFKELLDKEIILYDETVKIICIKNQLKHNPLENENQTKSIAKIISTLPKSSIYSNILEQLNKRFHEPLREQLAKLIPQPETETETETETKGGFIPPELSEVSAYCQERKNNVDPQTWIDFYTAKGWMIGKNKMKDWKAAVRTWEQRGDNNSTQKTDIPRYVPSAEDKAQWRM